MSDTRQILLHVCCAPCLATAVTTLRHHDGMHHVGKIYFYNPNIHPLLEFRRRCKALQIYLERNPLPAEIDDVYGLPLYLDQVKWSKSPQERCQSCYALRLSRAAALTASLGLAGFTTTLLASREQDRDLVAEVGQSMGRQYGVEFLNIDLRRLLPDEKMLRGIYKQQYCGCVFSEEERFRQTQKHLYLPKGMRDDEE